MHQEQSVHQPLTVCLGLDRCNLLISADGFWGDAKEQHSAIPEVQDSCQMHTRHLNPGGISKVQYLVFLSLCFARQRQPFQRLSG